MAFRYEDPDFIKAHGAFVEDDEFEWSKDDFDGDDFDSAELDDSPVKYESDPIWRDNSLIDEALLSFFEKPEDTNVNPVIKKITNKIVIVFLNTTLILVFASNFINISYADGYGGMKDFGNIAIETEGFNSLVTALREVGLEEAIRAVGP